MTQALHYTRLLGVFLLPNQKAQAMMNSPLGRFRIIALAEGVSYLFLLLIAMPLKYFADMPDVVKYTGWIHGILFVLFVLALIQVMFVRRWSILKSILAFISSLIPAGAFWLEKQLKKEQEALAGE